MKWVMQMKKLLCILLILLLLAGGLFLWKGGHHAVMLAGALADWLDADAADQSILVQLQRPTFAVDESNTIQPQVQQLSFTADTFWREYQGDTVYGLTAGSAALYIRDNVLYMDTGKAYSIPRPVRDTKELRELVTALLLYGRVTKSQQGYSVDMETDALRLHASVAVDKKVTGMVIQADLTMDGEPVTFQITVNSKETTEHPIPQTVLDAMVLAEMEQPMSLSEPLEVLVPAMEDLFPLTADAKLGVECGILTLSETVTLTIEDGQAAIVRDGVRVDLTLPTELSPVTMGLLLLRNGEFTRTGDAAQFCIALPADTTAELVSALVPQAASLGITFGESTAALTIASGRLTAAAITAEGSVPFLITTIPLSFSAEFDIH